MELKSFPLTFSCMCIFNNNRSRSKNIEFISLPFQINLSRKTVGKKKNINSRHQHKKALNLPHHKPKISTETFLCYFFFSIFNTKMRIGGVSEKSEGNKKEEENNVEKVKKEDC